MGRLLTPTYTQRTDGQTDMLFPRVLARGGRGGRGLFFGGGECDDDIITKVSDTVDGAKRVRAHPRVLQRRHWYRSRHDVLVRRGHGRQKRESYRKRGRVKDDAVHGGV